MKDGRDKRSGYTRLNISELNHSKKTLTFEQATKDIEPIHWSKDVLDGKKKITISGNK